METQQSQKEIRKKKKKFQKAQEMLYFEYASIICNLKIMGK